MAKTLHISDDLKLPLDYATKTAAILAQRRKGKTYTASVIAEEMVAVKQPFVALDPTGAWWGLRASADGSAAGLPVVILGGQHGDVPLERTAGRLIADLVVDSPGYYVIDFSLFESGEAERQFAVDFAERLYRAKAQPGKNFPLHLFVDEADRFIPQSLTNKSETSPRLLGAFEAIVRRGGLRGLGTTLISQRAAVVNKNVLEMLDILITLRTIGPNDQKAVKGYVQAHGSEKELADIMGSLASLAIGEAWFWEPGADLIKRVQIRQRRTFNSSATPDTAERTVEPKQLAKVDLEALTQRMAETIERAKADDPKELRRQLAEAKRELQKRPVEILPTGIKTPSKILTEKDRELLERLATKLESCEATIRGESQAFSQTIHERVAAAVNTATMDMDALLERGRTQFAQILQDHRLPALLEKLSQVERHTTPEHRPAPPGVVRPSAGAQSPGSPGVAREPRRPPATGPSGETLAKGERVVLTAIAQHHSAGVTREQLTVLTGYKRSSRDTYLQKLQQRDLVTMLGPAIIATDAGVATLGRDFEPLPTGDQLRRYWIDRLPAGERVVLEVLVAAYPKSVTRDAISDDTGYKRSSRDTYLQKLISRRLADPEGRGEVRASRELFG